MSYNYFSFNLFNFLENEAMEEVVPNLPQTQLRLFERIQQKQKENILKEEKTHDESGVAAADVVEPIKDESWYSSDEDRPEKPDKTIPRKKRWDVEGPLDQAFVVEQPKVLLPMSTGPIILPKELTEVLSAIKKDVAAAAPPIQTPVEVQPVEVKPKPANRDPR